MMKCFSELIFKDCGIHSALRFCTYLLNSTENIVHFHAFRPVSHLSFLHIHSVYVLNVMHAQWQAWGQSLDRTGEGVLGSGTAHLATMAELPHAQAFPTDLLLMLYLAIRVSEYTEREHFPKGKMRTIILDLMDLKPTFQTDSGKKK